MHDQALNWALMLTVISAIGWNFLYQVMNNRRWRTAVERSFFQLIALLIFLTFYRYSTATLR
jgi:hypothetical protein